MLDVPGAAAGAFQKVVPIGPYSLLKSVGGVNFTAPGVIDMASGAFTQTGSVLLPYAAVYGPDVGIYAMLVGLYVVGDY